MAAETVGELFSTHSSHGSLLISLSANVVGVNIQRSPSKVFPGSELFSTDCVFVTKNGTPLYDPTAAAKYISRLKGRLVEVFFPSSFSAEYERWIEWVENTLNPSVTSSISHGVSLSKDVVALLENAISGSGFVVGTSLSLVDIILWWSLYPLLGDESKQTSTASTVLLQWFRALQSTPAFVEAVKLHPRASEPSPATASTSIPSPGNPKVPIKGQRNILVTSALPYVNNVPHLGNIIGCVLSADVYARYCRRRGYNVVYICGTDEYGTATETKALAEKTTPREICDKFHAIHTEVYEWFGISFDRFGRTSTPKQTEICQAIFHSLLKQKRLLEDTMEQPYCDTCQRFLADRFVEGLCPTPGCGFEDARGDQCDKCGKLLNPTDLLNPRCNVCHTPPRVRQTEHLFLDLPALKCQLEAYVSATSAQGGWSPNCLQTTSAWLRDGLKPRCITRDLKWGVPVPLDKYRDKVFYVWFDAPIGYISITAGYTDSWREWWQSPEDVELVQFMGKDNVPFHTVIFPCTLLGTAEPWTLMRSISVTEYLNYEGGKFSKSRGVGVFGTDVRETTVPAEVWRYYLLTNRPEVSDTMFTWADLQAKQNNELLKNLGNFVNRTLAFLAKPAGEGFGSVVPEAPDADKDELTADLGQKTGHAVQEYVDNMEKIKLKAGLKTAMAISSLGNVYLQESKFWKLVKDDLPRCAVVLRTSVGLVHLLATLLEPFMPSFSLKVLRQLNLPEASLRLSEAAGDLARAFRPWETMPAQHRIGVPEPIFSEMKDEEVQAYRERFSGSQADREEKKVQEETKKLAQPKAEGKKAEKKGEGEKKEGKKGGKKGGEGSSASKEGPVDVSRLEIRVGRIVKVQKHPDADSLYLEEIDVGEGAPRVVVSGLVKFVPIEEMQNRKVCVLCNLKPASMRGVKSHAMVLAASNADHTKVELLTPPEASKPGDRVTASGFSGDPDPQLNPKKKVWESIQPDLTTNLELVACYKGLPLVTADGPCTVSSLADASIG